MVGPASSKIIMIDLYNWNKFITWMCHIFSFSVI